MGTEDKKEEEDSNAPAWGSARKANAVRDDLTDKKYPTLKGASNIVIDEGPSKVNIKTSKNVFEALGDGEDDSDGPSRPKEIRAAMVQKKKGEFAKTAVQNAVNKAKQDNKKSKRAE